MSESEIFFNEVGSKVPEVNSGKLFGKPCFKIDKKAFCCFFKGDMVFKLGKDEHQDAISLDRTQLFDPSGKGRPMKEWVQVPFDYQEHWERFAHAAAKYVGGK